MANERRKSSAVSVGNWMWSLFLSALLPMVISAALIFAYAKTQLNALLYALPLSYLVYYVVVACTARRVSKRNWAIANIIWILIIAAVVICTVVFFGDAILTALLALLNTPVTGLLG